MISSAAMKFRAERQRMLHWANCGPVRQASDLWNEGPQTSSVAWQKSI
jgi:hypothetical protein